MIALAALLAAVAVPPAAAAPPIVPLSERVPDVATRFCVDFVSRAVPLPAVGAEETSVFTRYSLTPGLSSAAFEAIGAGGTSLLAGATLASGEARDGAFAVALGGSAGDTCRIIVYRAPVDGLFVQQSVEAMKRAGRDWRTLPTPAQMPSLLRISMLRRDAAKHPFLANLIAPMSGKPVAMVVNVAMVPPNATLPQGY